MMKYTVVLVTLLVCTFASPLFPHINGYNQYPTNIDQDDGVFQGGAQQGGVQNQFNDDGEDDDQIGVAGQTATTMAPGDSSSGSSSGSSEEATLTPAPAGPIVGQNPPVAPQSGPDAGAAQAGQNSGDTNTYMISQVDAAPIGAYPDPGNTSGQQYNANANPLNMQRPSQQKQEESRQSSLALAGTTLFLVAGVAATAAVSYKYKDAIRGRLGV